MGEELAICQVCGTTVEEGHACPTCMKTPQSSEPAVESSPEPSLSVVMAAGIGGMMAFFGFGFGIVAAVAMDGFWIISLSLLTISGALILLAWRGRRVQLKQWKKEKQVQLDKAKCSYCGGQNQARERKCSWCGAPLP